MAEAAANPETAKPSQHWWTVWCWIVGGICLNGTGALTRFNGKFPFYSEPVLLRISLTATVCAAFSFLVVLLVPKLKLRDTGVVFFLLSALAYPISFLRS